MTGAGAIKIENLSYRYAVGDGFFYALKDLNLTIDEGEFVAITGASGSGKTTLMNLLGTLATTTDGTLRLAGENTATLGDDRLAALRNRSIGFVFQQFHLLPRLTVLENVLLPLSYLNPRPKTDERQDFHQRAYDLLNRLGIADQAEKMPATLSGGQKQRVAICRALLMDPPIILADEPTGALDSRTSREVLRIFGELHAEGRTVLLITHDRDVSAAARRKIELRDGVVVHDIQQPGQTAADLVQTDGGLATAAAPRAPRRRFPRLGQLLAPLAEAWQALTSAKLRTALTSLGLIIGVSSITIMLTLGTAAQNIILQIFNQAGSDRIYVGPDFRAARSGPQQGWIGLDLDSDFHQFENAFAKVGRIVPLGDTVTTTFVAAGNAFEGRTQQVFDVHDFLDKGAKLETGRMIAPHEFQDGCRVAVIGSEFADELFPPTYPGRATNHDFPLGETLALRGNFVANLTIIGILKKLDTTFESTDVNQRVYVPMATYAKYTGDKHVRWFAVVPKKGLPHKRVANAVTNWLRLKTNLRMPFRAHVPEEVIGRILLFISVFQMLTALIGGLCILVGGIGIMNIMLVTIAERIREIGLRKALGAAGRDVTRQFLTECILLCAASGIGGTLVGLVFCNVVGLVGHLLLPDTIPGELLLNPIGVAAGIGTSALCGVAFGMMPALKAARLDPSEALRSE